MNILGGFLLGLGLALLWLGGLGMARFRSPYVRLQVAGVADIGGAWSFLVGLIFYTGWAATGGLTVVLMLFLLFTSPLATHAIAKSAFTRGMRH
ncbi:MAG: monovalent cation/H(+) antiporter subunit G [Candidatus Bipolaricaulota bacterium]|nr:monovalent cation/H(+) antiporter subunit G [Candidatus Bipolaricaulota bacterium]MDW8126562.1 monovalent cation/H(+) antiporter subunit G [Candidatus Bipolaricaulota bacterium]